MGFEIDIRQASLGHDLRRVALDQIDAALGDLARGGNDLPEQIHRLRKRTKKLRSLVRVIGGHLAGHQVDLITLRDMARRLAGLRDAEVMLTTFDALGGPDALRLRLDQARATAYGDATLQSRLDRVRDDLTALRHRIADWHLNAKDFALLETGIRRTWHRCCTRMDQVRKSPHPETIHDWRKRVKDHAYQARLLQPIWPEALAPTIATAMQLEEQLGQIHDLDLLIDWLRQQPEQTEVASLIPLARSSRASLLTHSLALGARLFAGSGADLVLRWSAWWRLAHKAAVASGPNPGASPRPIGSGRQLGLDQGNGLGHPEKGDKPAKPRPL